jgi:hypothetical protein
MVLAIDFDGTAVTHDYPEVGKEIGASFVLKELVQNGHQLILWTMRSGKELEDAVNWFKENDIPLYGIQRNPTQDSWTDSPKCYAQIYIDDAALGCPLYRNPSLSDRPFVDWTEVREILVASGAIIE